MSSGLRPVLEVRDGFDKARSGNSLLTSSFFNSTNAWNCSSCGVRLSGASSMMMSQSSSATLPTTPAMLCAAAGSCCISILHLPAIDVECHPLDVALVVGGPDPLLGGPVLPDALPDRPEHPHIQMAQDGRSDRPASHAALLAGDDGLARCSGGALRLVAEHGGVRALEIDGVLGLDQQLELPWPSSSRIGN